MSADGSSMRNARRWAIRLLVVVLALELGLQVLSLVTRFGYGRTPGFWSGDSYRILCIGDSNTYGLYLPAADAWPAQLQRRLDAELGAGHAQVISLAFPGSPSSRLAENIHSMMRSFEPDLVIALAGMNDHLYGAFDGTGGPVSLADRARGWATRNLRLFRLFLDLTRPAADPGRIENPADRLFREQIERLPGQSRAERLVTLAALYTEIGIAVDTTAEGSPAIVHGERRANLADLAQHLDGRSTFEATRMVLEYVTKVGIPLTEIHVPGTAEYDGARFDLEPVPARVEVADSAGTIGRNFGFVRDAVEERGARFVLMTYLSDQHFYGPVNRELRQIAQDRELSLIDLEPAGRDACRDPGACGDLFFPDGHPTAEGYREVAEAVWESPQLRDALDAPSAGRDPASR